MANGRVELRTGKSSTPGPAARRPSRTSGIAALALLSALVAGCENGSGTPSGGSTSLNPGPVPTTTTTPSRTTPSLTPLPKVFDETAVQDSVFKVLVDSYQVQNLDTVICPPDQPVRTGHQFQCSAKIDGERKSVPITVTSDTGAYDVGMPK